MRSLRVTSLFLCLALALPGPLFAQNNLKPVITSATVSADGTTLFITGSAFGSAPAVTLGGFLLGGVTVNSNGTLATAAMPALPSGSYQLVIQTGNNNKSGEFAVAVGAMGPEGPTGPPGANGANGADGADGANGAVGPTGPAGSNGANGADGAVGPTGAAGANGAVGPTGPGGANGAVGPTGPAGTNGTDGTNGAVGPTGPAGPAGTNGTNGAVGPTGPAGANGAVGPTGPAGANGTNGTNGTVGPTGPAGANGAVGPTGPVGPAGPVGPTGSNATIGTVFSSNLGADPVALAAGSTIAFIGSTASVTITAGKKIHVTAAKALGSSLAGGGYQLSLWICYQSGSSPLATIGFGTAGLTVPQNQRQLFGISGLIEGLPAGTYTVGMCGNGTNFNSNEGSYTTVLVF